MPWQVTMTPKRPLTDTDRTKIKARLEVEANVLAALKSDDTIVLGSFIRRHVWTMAYGIGMFLRHNIQPAIDSEYTDPIEWWDAKDDPFNDGTA